MIRDFYSRLVLESQARHAATNRSVERYRLLEIEGERDASRPRSPESARRMAAVKVRWKQELAAEDAIDDRMARAWRAMGHRAA